MQPDQYQPNENHRTNRDTIPAMATRQQLATYLQVSAQCIDKLTKRGVIQSHRVGRLIRFQTASVLASLESVKGAA